MDTQQFLAEFRHIANAPGGVARLRDLILELAIKGQIVGQRTEEGDARLALSKLKALREITLHEENVSATRKHKNLEPPVGRFQIPSNWAWEYLGYLSVWPLKDGDWIESKDQDPKGDVRIIQLADVGIGTYRNRSRRFLTSTKAAELGCYYLKVGDVLIARLPDPLGRACVFPGDEKPSVTVVDIAVCRCAPDIINPRYLMNCINAPSTRKIIDSWAIGTTRQRVATGKLGTLVLPVAPIEEQSRIITKVDELMALCDQLEKQQNDQRKLQNALRQSSLQIVAAASSPHELRIAWTRLVENFGRLFSAPEDVAELRTLLLEMAIQGALTEKLPSDGDASQLIRDLRQSRGKRTRTLKTMSANRALETVEENPPFPLPRNWIWARLSDIGYLLGGGTPSKSNLDYWRGEVPWVSPKDMKVAYIDSAQDTITQKAVDETSVRLIPSGALLFVVRGMILAHSFPVAVACRELTINQDMKALCPFLPEMSDFLLLMLSGSKRRFLGMVERSTHGTCRLETERFSSCVVGLPPIPEQRRIIARVNELMRVCDDLECKLRDARTQSERLVVAAISTLAGIAVEKAEDEPVKAPQTELIAPLCLGRAPDVQAQAPLATLLAHHHGEMLAGDLWRRFGGEIDAFYAQLKTEVARGWIAEPRMAEVREKDTDTAAA